MVLRKFLGSKATRSLTVFSVLAEAKQSFDRGHKGRALLMLAVAAVAWKWTLAGMAAQGLVRLLRKGGSSASGSGS